MKISEQISENSLHQNFSENPKWSIAQALLISNQYTFYKNIIRQADFPYQTPTAAKMDRISEAQIQNYQLIRKVGEGSTSQVVLAKQKIGKFLCVLKAIQKNEFLSKDEEQRLIQEKEALLEVEHPYIVRMFNSFQTRKHCFFVLQYCPGGDLYSHLHTVSFLPQNRIAFYGAQLVITIKYLHSKNMIYRDLKPQNILIGKDGYLKLTDFGMSKSRIMSDQFRTFSLCGTSEYMAPEMLLREGHGKAYDWWTLGCCLYQLQYKKTPFYSDNRKEMFQSIISKDPQFNQKTSPELKDLIQGLLAKQPEDRMDFISKIEEHAFFKLLNFEKVKGKIFKAPFIPDYSRGKKLLKVSKEEIGQFIELETIQGKEQTPICMNYLQGFDYSPQEEQTCPSLEEKNDTKSHQVEQATQKIRKWSTQDEQQEQVEKYGIVQETYQQGEELQKFSSDQLR